ncbi:MAG: hypothetical protein GY777_14355 [Candidatus Brocadiaceae bacterium]|nr:hypothetical protein [Candidatus Brocadiaceae bacterium]
MDHEYFVLTRAVHVIAIIIWIGGVAFVTTVLIPALRKTQSPEDRLQLFETLENRFSFQAKFTTLLAGITGFYMLHIMDAWSSLPWWIYPMIFVWAIFTVVLFIFEPLFLHKWFLKQAAINNEKSFLILQIMHIVLLTISLLAAFAGVAGVHGFVF